jgi:hypothetical protein
MATIAATPMVFINTRCGNMIVLLGIFELQNAFRGDWREYWGMSATILKTIEVVR